MIAIDFDNPISDKIGGACEKLIYYIVKELSKTYEIHLIVQRKTLDFQAKELKSSVYFHGFDSRSRFVPNLMKYIRFFSYLYKLNVKHDFDVFHSFSFLLSIITLLVSKLCRKPLIVSELSHERWIHKRKSFSSKASFWVNIVPTIWLATAIVAPSKFIKESISKSVKCLPKKVKIIPYGVPSPTNLPSRNSFRKKYGIPSHSPILTFVGRSVPHKGIHNIIKALHLLKKYFPDIRLVIAGPQSGDFTSSLTAKSPYHEYLLSLTNNLGLSNNVIFAGFLEIEALSELFVDTTIFVFPSTEEAFGLVLIEALSIGLPIITTNVPPMTEIVDDRSGGFVMPDSPDQIAEKVRELLSNPKLLKEISQYNVRKFNAEYELSHMINKYRELYESIDNIN
jgi:glycosyltransferase involved in cell wall biosynthesis